MAKNDGTILTPVSRQTATFVVNAYVVTIRALSTAGTGTISLSRNNAAVLVSLGANTPEYFRVVPGETVTLAGDTVVNEMAG